MRRHLREEPIDERLRSAHRAPCGHLGECGCEASPCCLECPLKACVLDKSRKTAASARRKRQRSSSVGGHNPGDE